MTPAPTEPPERDLTIATGNRRDETHFETDDQQMVRVAHLARPQAPLPRHEATAGAGLEPDKPAQPIEDVKVDAAEGSVWDGRPPEDRSFKPTGQPLRSAPREPERPKPPFPPAELVSKRAGG